MGRAEIRKIQVENNMKFGTYTVYTSDGRELKVEVQEIIAPRSHWKGKRPTKLAFKLSDDEFAIIEYVNKNKLRAILRNYKNLELWKEILPQIVKDKEWDII